MLLPLLFILPLLAACGGAAPPPTPTPTPLVGTVVPTAHGQYRNITSDELSAMLTRKDFFLVDVHVPHEGKMPDLDARIPYDQIANHLDQLPSDKAAKIVLICKGGGMSATAAGTLADLGYTNVYNLAGGFVGWRDKGYPLTPEP
jgi:rhodanese-related sulfurtransferase